MRVVIADISGKVTNYDVALVKALNNQEGASKYVFMAPRLRALHLNFPHRSLLTLVPEKYANSEGKLKRYVKAIEGCLNYVYLVAFLTDRFRRVEYCCWLCISGDIYWSPISLHSERHLTAFQTICSSKMVIPQALPIESRPIWMVR